MSSSGQGLVTAAALWASLFAFWLLLSGIYTPFLIGAGAGSALAVAAMAWRMDVVDREGHPVHLTLAALAYWPWLAVEIVKSGLQVAAIIVHPRLPISPSFVHFKPSQTSTLGLVTHANSITLTPGTITVRADHGEFLVHALTQDGAEGLTHGAMDRRVSRLEGSAGAA